MLTDFRLPLAVVVASAPLAIGATRADVQFSFAMLVALVALMAAFSDRLKDARVEWAKWLLFISAGWSLIQLIPLPIGIVRSLSPNTAALYLAADPKLTWVPLSVDFSRTASATLHLFSFALVFLTASVGGRSTAATLRWAVIVGAALSGLIGVGHWLLGAEQIFGLYEAVHRSTLHGFFGPFVNENTFAGLLVLGALLAAGKMGASDTPLEQGVATACALICTFGVVATGSRGGLLALLIGWVLFVVVTLRRAQADEEQIPLSLSRLLLSGSALILVGGVLSLTMVEGWQEVMGGSIMDDPKVRIWQSALPLLDTYGWFGSGRGTFGLVFEQVQSYPIRGSVSHAENFLLQSSVESGIPVTLLILVSIGALWLQGIKIALRRNRPTTAAAVAGVTAVAVQQVTDFGMESMGLSLGVAAALGTVFTGRRSAPPERTTRGVLLFAAILILLLGAMTASSIFSTQSDRYLDALNTAPLSTVSNTGQRLSADHPADAMVPLTVAQRLAQDPESDFSRLARWSAQVLRLDPENGRIHLILARVLIQKKRYAQAAGEYRLALRKQPWKALSILKEIAGNIPSASHLAASVRGDSVAENRLFTALFALGRHTTVSQLAAELSLLMPNRADVARHWARACLRLNDLRCTTQQIERVRTLGEPLFASGLEARLAAQQGEVGKARELIQGGLNGEGPRHQGFLKNALKVAWKLGDQSLALRIVDHLWTQSAGRSYDAMEALSLRGRTEAIFKRHEKAIHAYEQASALGPRPEFALAAARSELALERRQAAILRLQNAQVRWPDQPQIRGLLERLLKRDRVHGKSEGDQHD